MSIIKDYWWQISLTILAFGAAFSVLGVYDTHELPAYMRYTFWTTTMFVGVISSVLAMPYIVNGILKDKHPFFHILCVSLLCSIPVTVVLTIFNPSFGVSSPLYFWGLQYFYVLLVSLVVGSILYPLLHMMGAIGKTDEADDSVDSAAAFLQRLPSKYHTAELYAISSEDHYLRVYTNKGEDLILMRLADALKELSDARGLQVHRSWWVNEDSIVDSCIEDGRRFLTLKADIKVPVSRTFSKDVQQILKPA